MFVVQEFVSVSGESLVPEQEDQMAEAEPGAEGSKTLFAVWDDTGGLPWPVRGSGP